MKKELSYKAVYLTFGILVVSFAIVSFAIAQWTEPTSSPPGANVATPLNVSNVGQSKIGGLILNTGGATNGLIVDQGNVGIGTTNPSRELHVYGSGTQGLRVESSDGQAEISVMSNSTGVWYMYSPGGSNDLRFFDTTDRVTFQAGGNVGIGTANPTAKLHIGGTAGVDGIRFPDGTLQTMASPIKAWVNFDGDTSPYTNIRDSYNISSIQYDGGGIWRVYWFTPFSDGNYTPFITTSAGPVRILDVNSTYIRFQVFSISSNPAAAVANWISVVVMDN